jgi:hypothetical protein
MPRRLTWIARGNRLLRYKDFADREQRYQAEIATCAARDNKKPDIPFGGQGKGDTPCPLFP